MAFGGRSQMKMSEETFDFVCTACARDSKTKEAVKYCVECSGYCCQLCTDTHKKFPALSNHNLMDVTHGTKVTSQQPSLPEFPTERCCKHTGKVVDMYCEDHDAVGCYVCFAKDHKFCDDSHIHSIPDMIDTLFKLSDCKQVHSLLKDMMVSMETLSISKDTQLQVLSTAKKEALDKVMKFHKALEAILRKVAEYSKNKVEAAYNELKNKILQEKRTVDSIYEDLQTTDEKLTQSEGNRAQRFVFTKIAKEKVNEADSEKVKCELNYGKELSFIPNQSLLTYIESSEGIGQVQTYEKQLYGIKGSTDIPFRLSNDSSKCWSLGSCLTHDEQLLVTDRDNKKLKRVNLQQLSIVDYCTLDSTPFGVCCISQYEVAVACMRDNKIQFVSIHNKMTTTRQIKMPHKCFGIAFNDDKLYVTDNGDSLYIYGITGTLLNTIRHDNAGNKLFTYSRHVAFNGSGNRMFVGNLDHGLLCFDGIGNYMSTIKDTEIERVSDVCMDGRENIFVAGNYSHNVVQFSENGKKVGVMVKKEDGLHKPKTVCFHQRLNRLFVTMESCDALKMFELV